MGGDKEINVWLVDDATSYRDAVTFVLNNSEGLICPHAFSNAEELEEFAEQKQHLYAPDVILLDIRLPGKNGIEALPLFLKMYPKVVVVMLTTHEDEDLIYSALRAGAVNYVTKSSSLDHLTSAIREAYNGGMLLSRNVAKIIRRGYTGTIPAAEDVLTSREKEILRLLADGKSQDEIAQQLFVSYHTVVSHVRNIREKLGVKSVVHAVAKALEENLI